MACPEALFHERYMRLGATRDRQKHRETWLAADSGTTALKAKCLIKFARHDHCIERVLDTAGILARLGQDALSLVLQELAKTDKLPELFIETLLIAVRWSTTELSQAEYMKLILEFSRTVYNEDIREAAYLLSERLFTDTAKCLLEKLMTNEPSNDLCKELLAMLQKHPA